MGIHIVKAENIGAYANAMEQAYRLRHAVFVEEMGWSDLMPADGAGGPSSTKQTICRRLAEGAKLDSIKVTPAAPRGFGQSDVTAIPVRGALHIGHTTMTPSVVGAARRHGPRSARASPAKSTQATSTG